MTWKSLQWWKEGFMFTPGLVFEEKQWSFQEIGDLKQHVDSFYSSDNRPEFNLTAETLETNLFFWSKRRTWSLIH